MKNMFGCVGCRRTGLLSATLDHSEEGDMINVVVCGSHKDTALAEKTLLSMKDNTPLPIYIVGTEVPRNNVEV